MALKTFSVFYYGQEITENNKYINFTEGAGPELTAELEIGSYTLSKFRDVISSALNNAGNQVYTVVVDRFTRKITISAPSVFSLLGATGSLVGQSALPTMGFTNTDYISGTAWQSDNACGYAYKPQFWLQEYVKPEHNLSLYNAVKTKSADGNKVSIQSFGEERMMKCNIKFITNVSQDADSVIRSNDQGLEDYLAFMDYCCRQNPVEFMEDEADPTKLYRLRLDKTPQSSDGFEHEPVEKYDVGLPYYYESGKLEFRVIQE